MSKIKKAVIPVAGFGTRFLPAAKAFSKALLPIVDKPVLQFLVEDAVAAGIEEIIFVVSPDQQDIPKYFAPASALEERLQAQGDLNLLAEIQKISELAKFDFVIQKEMRGDGNAIWQAQEKIGAEAFLVLFGDDLIFGQPARQLVEIYERENSAVVGLQKVAKSEVGKYGIVGIQEDFLITQFVEKPKPADAPSDLAIVGKYICTPRIFEILASNPDSSGEIRLIDALAILLEEEKIFGEILAGQRFDCGSKAGWLAANNFVARQHPEIFGIL